MRKILFVHTADIQAAPERRSGTDIAVAELREEISRRWEVRTLTVPVVSAPFLRRQLDALRTGAMPVVVDRLLGAPDVRTACRPDESIVLADDYAGLLLAKGWKPGLLIRHNAFHDSYAKTPRRKMSERIVLGYHGWLARRFDRWTSLAAEVVAAPAGTTEVALRRLVPEARILPWRPRVPRREEGPSALRDTRRLEGVYFANFAYAPNFAGLEFLCSVLAPALLDRNVGFHVFGPGAVERSKELSVPPNVEIHGFQPDLEGFVTSKDFGILPIFQGEGILLKTLSLMGMGMPIVSTTKAAAGTGLVDGTNALIADDPGAMASAILRLEDAGLRRRLGAQAWIAAEPFSNSSGINDAVEAFLASDRSGCGTRGGGSR